MHIQKGQHMNFLKILSSVVTFTVIAGFFLGLMTLPTRSYAQENDTVTACHATHSDIEPYIRIVGERDIITTNHFDANGQPLPGHEDDLLLDGEQTCPDTRPTPTPTSTPTETPSPTPTVTATPTPTPTSSEETVRTSLSKNGPTCEELNFSVTFTMTERVDDRDEGIENVEVTFRYDGEEKKATTNSEGKASVTYAYSGEGDITATPANGNPSQTIRVDELSCPATGGDVQTQEERVLGASTTELAPTGRFHETVFKALAGLFSGILTFGVVRFALVRR
jgi:hypothetical protein